MSYDYILAGISLIFMTAVSAWAALTSESSEEEAAE